MSFLFLSFYRGFHYCTYLCELNDWMLDYGLYAQDIYIIQIQQIVGLSWNNILLIYLSCVCLRHYFNSKIGET
jgi:hypothetical protein